MRKIVIAGVISLILLSGFLSYGLYCIRYRSLSQYNILPQREIEKYLKETYGITFSVLASDFYRKEAYYIWEYQYIDAAGMRFVMYYVHPYESMEGYVHLAFQEPVQTDIVDTYLEQKMKVDYEDVLYWKNGMLNEYIYFDIGDFSKLEEVTGRIVDVLYYSFQYLNRPSDNAINFTIYWKGDYKGYLSMDEIMYSYKDKEREELYTYVYNKLQRMR